MAIATFSGRYTGELLMLFMTFCAFLIISVHKILNFGHFSQKHYGRTDRWTDRRTNGRTDTPSYRDAKTHLKMSDLCRVWEAMHTCAVRAAFINKKRSLAKSKWNAQTPLRHAISLRVISLSSEKLFRSIFHFLVLPFNFRPLPSALFFLFSPLPSLLQSSYLATPTTKAATFDFHLSDLLILQLRIIFPMCYLKRRTYRLAHSLAIT